VMASVREFAPWINGMVLAGVGGTAVCADLGDWCLSGGSVRPSSKT